MRAALICVTNHNYGSILQTYALQEKIRSMGCDTTIIKYREPICSKLKRCTDAEYLQTRIKMVMKRFSNRQIASSLNVRAHAFERFINSKLFFSETFNSLDDISSYCRNFDIVILGSDQVWHPMNIIMNYFTLNFVPDEICKAAYAPSFGVKEIPSRYVRAYKSFIPRFQYLSSREKQGVELIKQLTGRDAKFVCDPTMLLMPEEWRVKFVSAAKPKEQYIFCYFIGNNPQQRNAVKAFSKKTGFKITAILHVDEYIAADEDFCDEALYDVTPLDFIKLIDQASYVFTDSFHASVFSILFHKTFWVFDRFENNGHHSTSSRITSLLDMVGLHTRFIHKTNNFSANVDTFVDYKAVDCKLNEVRTDSLSYLYSFIDISAKV